jgi:predicted tellurium resistance membrane protein TerC
MKYVNYFIGLFLVVIAGSLAWNHLHPFAGIAVWLGVGYYVVYRFINFVTNLENKESK